MNNIKDISLTANFQENLTLIEDKVTTLTKKNPALVLTLMAGTGIVMGYIGLKNVIKAGMWLKANDQIPYSKLLKSFGA